MKCRLKTVAVGLFCTHLHVAEEADREAICSGSSSRVSVGLGGAAESLATSATEKNAMKYFVAKLVKSFGGLAMGPKVLATSATGKNAMKCS